jgi:hypothetical protein
MTDVPTFDEFVDLLRNAPETFVAMVAIGILAVVLDTVWRGRRPAGTATAGHAGVGVSRPA